MDPLISSSSSSAAAENVVIFPFLSKGHIIPLLQLSANLASKGIGVTLITTPSNSTFFHQYLQLPKPNIHVKLIPFPSPTVTSLPPGVESSDRLSSFDLFTKFLHATALLDQPFRQALKRMVDVGDAPLCVISDMFSGWTLKICREFSIPRLVFHGMGVFSMSVIKALLMHQTHFGYKNGDGAAGSDQFHVPGTPDTIRLKYSDVPESIRSVEDNEITQFVIKNVEDELNSWGVIVNSFAGIDDDYVSHFESFYKDGGTKAWLLGPFCLHSLPHAPAMDMELVEWFGEREEGSGSVLYVSFGTMFSWPEEQLDEIWHGLETSGCEYIWAVRSQTWEPPESKEARRGLILNSFVPQMEVLQHPSVGGFLSHCGWNSVLESLAAKVPILAWPVINEQSLNARFVVDVIGAAIMLGAAGVGGGKVVGRDLICEGVRKLMCGEEGKRAREKVAEIGVSAKVAVEEGGSSCDAMNDLLGCLREIKRKNGGVSEI